MRNGCSVANFTWKLTLPSQTPERTNDSDHVEVVLSDEDTSHVLRDGEIIGGERNRWGSNYTFIVHVSAGPAQYIRAVYKPRDGEAPLYDFAHGSLYKREYAAYLLSRSLGWPRVPATVLREGPYGVGSIQRFVESVPRMTYFELLPDRVEELLRFAVFDVMANNADRKAGHCLLGDDGQVWSIDHGLTFHSDFKLRTVMVEYWGQRIPQTVLDDIFAVADRLGDDEPLARQLAEVMTEEETGALRKRIEVLLERQTIPQFDPYHNVPWPLV